MNSLFLTDLMDPNIKVFKYRPSPVEVTQLINTYHLVLSPEDQPTEVLIRDPLALPLSSTNLTTRQINWEFPLLAKSDTEALSFYQEHHYDLRPIVILDNSDQVIGIITPTLLVTNLLKHYAILNSFLETLLDTVNEAVAVVTQEGTVSHWNSVAQDTYSIPQKNILGKKITQFFHRDSLATLKILDEGQPVRQSYHSPRPGTHVLMNASPVLHDGAIIGAISSEQDITQIVRLNEKLSNKSSELLDLQQKITPSNDPFSQIIGKGQSIRRAISIAHKVASSEASILITGESGVGKELFAQAIHLASPRASQPLIALNCGAIPTALFESELFGYQGGAFTGAERKGKPGKLELAHGGTLFLDEVGELPLDLQVKLLRVLQDRCFYRLGGTVPITVSTRIIAATNRDLEKMIKTSEFREDLYYRLNVITLEVPPLRERSEDIPELVQAFLHAFALKHNKPIPSLSPEVIVAFLNYNWPGNVRELHNVTERLAILSDEGTLETKYLPAALQHTINEPFRSSGVSLTSRMMDKSIRRNSSLELERICNAIEETKGNKSAAAELLGISRGTLYYKLKQYALG